MSQDKYRHAFSHVLVAGTTFWCMYHTNKNFGDTVWIHGAYSTLCFYSFVGIWRYGNPQYGDDAIKIYDISQKMLYALVLPCFVTELYIRYGHDFYLAALHTVLPAVPTGIYLLRDDWRDEFIDIMIIFNSISGCAISIIQTNYFGIAATVNNFLNHFVLKNREIGDVPTKVFYNVGLCFFIYYAYKSLLDAM